MPKKSFYVDTCIYLNLWQKEIDKRGIKLWKIAQDFFEKYNDATICYSGFLLKEMQHILTEEEFIKKRKLFNSSENFEKIRLLSKEFNVARKMESELDYEISFFDIIHIILTKKSKSILVTRDRKLILSAKKYELIAKKPEELL